MVFVCIVQPWFSLQILKFLRNFLACFLWDCGHTVTVFKVICFNGELDNGSLNVFWKPVSNITLLLCWRILHRCIVVPFIWHQGEPVVLIRVLSVICSPQVVGVCYSCALTESQALPTVAMNCCLSHVDTQQQCLQVNERPCVWFM